MCLGDAKVAALAGTVGELNLASLNMDVKAQAAGTDAKSGSVGSKVPMSALLPLELEEPPSSDESTCDAVSEDGCAVEAPASEASRCPGAPRLGPSMDPLVDLPFLDLDAPAELAPPLPQASLSEFHAKHAQCTRKWRELSAETRRPEAVRWQLSDSSGLKSSEASVSGACTATEEECVSPVSSSCEAASEAAQDVKGKLFNIALAKHTLVMELLAQGNAAVRNSARDALFNTAQKLAVDPSTESEAVSTAPPTPTTLAAPPTSPAWTAPKVKFVATQAELEALRMQVEALREKLAFVHSQSQAQQQRSTKEQARLQEMIAHAQRSDEQLLRHIRQLRSESHPGLSASLLQLVAAAAAGGAIVALAGLARH
mmetsp:Transcript_67280/g.173233  ORF Transcript_67280/g.173233 Transcript_67280/m.173233 type:complete len:371 (+) Transcript_67280:45-1157(+)|eukprot:CAMPEP_0195064516 /NCGR_PEP_ID=MMETSP0448-20130528/10521_1 /TAXON_ID=66468 /ORGANISM="Heterocapsa triquestra, Strain CCMP 448" /LENGTH=370 /DNA_ID=CAMNT_0040095531 /DNA_START=41 /DNA_END=1153 /DNA_ORIENTATION=-